MFRHSGDVESSYDERNADPPGPDARGLSQVQLAERSRKDRAQIARWERDAVTPSLETLRELLHACGFDLDLSLVPYRGPDAQLEARLGKALERTPQERLQTMLKARRR